LVFVAVAVAMLLVPPLRYLVLSACGTMLLALSTDEC
jgi:hypothetical protein